MPRIPDRRRELRAFLVVPFVAALTWYVLILAVLAFVNGRLRLRTDVMAMAIGAGLLGLPVAAAITLTLAIPAYLAIRSTTGMSLTTALIAGGVVGLVPVLFFSTVANESTLISPFRGVLIGLTAAWAWWHAAGRPGSGDDAPGERDAPLNRG